ncbi:MAG TPA: MFS transporter [Anaerolineales bacterium]|nr:MFS transporter [Anaerolineales bacterium]
MSYFSLGLYTLIRVIMNTAYRMIYPFITIFARGLGVDISVISGLVANRAIVGVVDPFIFPFIETRGRKFGMLLGLGVFVVSIALVAVFPSLTTLGVSLIFCLVGKAIFDPSLTSYVADHISYEKRGTAIGFMEFAWSLAFILGIPAMGFIIARSTWSAPFWVLGVLGFVAFLFIALTLVDSTKPVHHQDGMFGHAKQIITTPFVLVALSIGLSLTAANEVVNLMFGVWLEDSFKLQIAALAGASAIIGLSELGGEGFVALFVDRVGKIRAAGIGLLANCVAAILLPLIGRTELGALVGLFLFYITFEFTIVSIIPLMTEVMPAARATTLSFTGAANSLGRAIGALLAPTLYTFGFLIVTGAAVAFNLLGLVAVWYVSRHHD